MSLSTNTVHEIKSPTCALELAVGSLLHTLTNNNNLKSGKGQPLGEEERQEIVHTLQGMEHTIATVSPPTRHPHNANHTKSQYHPSTHTHPVNNRYQ